MELHVGSWNTFGSSIGKISDAKKFLLTNDQNILLIQEAGCKDSYGNVLEGDVNVSIGGIQFKGHFAHDPEARKNYRCTTGILVQESLFSEAAVKVFPVKLTDVRRPLVCCTLWLDKSHCLFLSTIHATADTKTAISELEIITDYFERLRRNAGCEWEWILMGDFNAEPGQLSVTDSCKIVKSGYTTQQSGRELDYAIASCVMADELKIYMGMQNNVPNSSDHYPIFFDLKLNV